MMSSSSQIALLLFLVVSSLATLATICVAAQEQQQQQQDGEKATAQKQYAVIQEGLRRNKQEMCKFLLADIDNQNELLDLAKVTYLFESALDHLAKSSDYVTLMRPYVDQKVVENFDRQGGSYVLEISEARRQVIEHYEQAARAGASDLKKRKILEDAFYRACEFKLGTVVSEKAMYESALKAEKSLKVKLFAAEG